MNLEQILILKKGGIHIKKKNRGKFTESAKRAGMGVQEYARHILANKDKYSSTLVKRANFARNAKKFKHENGGIIRFQPGGTVKLDDYGYPADVTPAIVTQDSEFNKFLTTLPDNLRLTPEKDYHMYTYWKLSGKPENFKEGKRRGMFTWDDSDKGYHAGSIAEDRNTGIYHFMKPKHHPTVKYELDWFNKGLQTLEGGKQVPVEGKDKEFWEDFKSKYQLDTTGVDYRYVPIQKKGGPLGKPNFKESKEAYYYDPETDTVFAPDSTGEFYHHEMFHARPDLQLLESLKPYYHNLNNDVLKQFGADLSFVKKFNNDPGHFYSPEELGARVVAATEMLKQAGVQNIDESFLKEARLNENKYGDNFRDLLYMYNDENLIKIFNTFKYQQGGIIRYQDPPGELPALVQRVNKSKANFVQRLLDPNRKHIQNWVNPLSISTHKLGWATEDTKQGAFVYPEVQEINGELVDFTNPKYRRNEGINSAVERRDTVRMTPEQAKWFTENYKQYYPGFKDGGILKYQNPAMVLPEIVELQSKKIWNSKPVKKARKLFTAVNDRLNGDREWISGEPTKYGNYGEYPANKGVGAIGLLAGPSSASASAFKVTDLNGIKKVNIKLGNIDDYWYVGHQTGSANFPKIYKDGLSTNNGLNGTALHLTESYMDDFANGRLMQKHMSHEGADGLVVMKFPKSKFPSGKLDDISERLMDLGESKSFEVPSKYLQFFKRSQW